MPEEVPAASAWLLNKITGDLQGAKMWPVKLRSLKHQEALSSFEEANGFEFYFPLSLIYHALQLSSPTHSSSCHLVSA